MNENIEKEFLKLKKLEEKNQKNKKSKERNHKLIILGTIFELLNIEDEEYNVLLGYNLEFYNKNDEDKKIYKKRAEKLLEKRNNWKERRKNE